MLTVSGIVVVDPESEIKEFPLPSGKSVVFRVRGVGKDPYKNARHYYDVDVMVPLDALDQAREVVHGGKMLQIRIGELKGFKSEKGYVFATVSTRWNQIELLDTMFQPARKAENGE